MVDNIERMPEFLQNYALLKEVLDAEFSGLNTKEKGDRFSDLVLYLIPRTRLGNGIENLQKGKASYDDGVDITGESADGLRTLCVQAKYSIKRDIQEIDDIISDFQRYEHSYEKPAKQIPLFEKNRDDDELEFKPLAKIHYQLVMFSLRKELLVRYENSPRHSVSFYKQLRAEERLEIVDGDDILAILQSAYTKSYVSPAHVTLKFSSPVLRFQNVYMGILSSTTLRSMYYEQGNAIFYENIRDFLGESSGKVPIEGRKTVNQAIIDTIKNEPEQLLSRNNGLTFKAAEVEIIDDYTLELRNASIVNGCQTTVCIARYSTQECFVSARVVATSEAWEIAKSANRQTAPDEIDLELARFLRPQIADKIGQEHRTRITRPGHDMLNVLEVVYRREIAYEEIKSMFIGIFSRIPRNVFDNNYTELRYKVLEMFFTNEEQGFQLFRDLLTIQQAFGEVLNDLGQRLENIPQDKNKTSAQPHVSQIYQRIYKRSSYRAYVALLAACTAVNIDISDKALAQTTDAEYKLIRQFIAETVLLVESDKDTFAKYCKYAFSAVQAQVPVTLSKDEITRRMLQYMKDAKFANLIDRVNSFAAIG